MTFFDLNFTTKKIFLERQPKKEVNFFDCISKIIIPTKSDLFYAYEFCEKLDKYLRHIDKVKNGNKNIILYV